MDLAAEVATSAPLCLILAMICRLVRFAAKCVVKGFEMFLRMVKTIVCAMALVVGAQSANAASYGAGVEADLPSSFAMRHFAAAVPFTIAFTPGSAQLSSGAIDVLDQQIDWLKANADVNIFVIGQPDRSGTGAALAEARAQVVATFMQEAGIAPRRLSLRVMLGHDQPQAITFVHGVLSADPTLKRRGKTLRPSIDLPFAPIPISLR